MSNSSMEIVDIKTYQSKDKRFRSVVTYKDGHTEFKSYPRVLMEQKLGRKLLSNEDVHHLDGDVTNNDISNLEIVPHGEHQRQHNPPKYKDKLAVCEICGKKFIWTVKRQSNYVRDLNRNKNRIITCSKSCSSYYGRLIQLENKSKKISLRNSCS